MLQSKLAESLTARIFLITALILLCAGAVTFGLIAWATPSTYTAVVNDDLTHQVDALIEKLEDTRLSDSGPLLDAFIRASGASAMLVGPDGEIAETGSLLAIQPVYEDDTTMVTTAQNDTIVTYAADGGPSENTVTVTMSDQAAITANVQFADQAGQYALYITPRAQAENLAAGGM